MQDSAYECSGCICTGRVESVVPVVLREISCFPGDSTRPYEGPGPSRRGYFAPVLNGHTYFIQSRPAPRGMFVNS